MNYIDSNFRTPIGFYLEAQASHNSDEMSLGADQWVFCLGQD